MNIKIRNFLYLLKDSLFKNLDIIYTILIVTIKAINYNKLISPTFFSVHFVFQAIFSSVVIACSISLLFKPKGRLRFLYIFNLLISILLIADSAHTTSNFKEFGKGKNLIMIQVEALQQFVINQKVNGQEITPNLNKWL